MQSAFDEIAEKLRKNLAASGYIIEPVEPVVTFDVYKNGRKHAGQGVRVTIQRDGDVQVEPNRTAFGHLQEARDLQREVKDAIQAVRS